LPAHSHNKGLGLSGTPIAKATPRAGLASDDQRRRRSGLEVRPLALEDGLEKPERMNIKNFADL
jgi:hypothetical protein